MKKQIKPTAIKIPSPADLLAKAEKVADGLNLADYRTVMFTLRHKGFTFRAIAEWMSAELHRPITHTQVFRLLQVDVEGNPEHSAEEHNERLSHELREENESESREGTA